MSQLSSITATDCPTCDRPHPSTIEEVSVLPLEKAQRMGEFFSLLADPNRLRILSVLAAKEMCVCDLAAALNMSESAVSHQMRSLRAMRLVKYQKIGRNVFYRLQDHHVVELYRSVAEHLDEKED
jgi:ArsR family transcriptional regulator, lead/cadmium/zinc/bismuth-responsive transcriptional repressor